MTFKAIVLGDVTKGMNADRDQRRIRHRPRDTHVFRDWGTEEEPEKTKKDPVLMFFWVSKAKWRECSKEEEVLNLINPTNRLSKMRTENEKLDLTTHWSLLRRTGQVLLEMSRECESETGKWARTIREDQLETANIDNSSRTFGFEGIY